MLARHTRPAGGRWPHNWNWIVFRIRDFSTIGNSINWFLPGPMRVSGSHLLTHSLQFTYYAKLTEISEIQQIHNPTQFNWTPTVTIFYCQKRYWVLFQFKWNIKFCWLRRLISGNSKFLFWNYFNFLARSLTKHNCWHKCVIVCFSNIFP